MQPYEAVAPLTTGPTLFKFTVRRGRDPEIPLEFAASLEAGEDPPIDAIEVADDVTWQQLDDNKIGGTPCFMQGEEYSSYDRTWHLLLQLTDRVPFADPEPPASCGQALDPLLLMIHVVIYEG
jgi:hypothetical protein